jgi:lipopolysaccharide/colanic/teichoic acid biosynthesis glycosyltransferase
MNIYGIEYDKLPPEPPEAFHCKPPSQEFIHEFQDIYSHESPLPDRFLKLAFDKVISLSTLILLSPVILLLYLANTIEGLIIPENRGPFVFSYIASTAERPFRKHKIRQIKMNEIDPVLAAKGLWHAYAKEWSKDSLTYLGRIVKALYLDELPQFWDILIGNMSLVGPRPLSWHHYERDLAQGNVTRKILKAGLLGPGQAQKGTSLFGDPRADFEYVRNYIQYSPMKLLILDLRIIMQGIMVVFRKRSA